MRPAREMKFSADYPGPLCELVEKETGAPCLFLQGAAGDLSANPGKWSGPEAFGQAVGREALALAKGIRCAAPARPALVGREENFKFAGRLDLDNAVVMGALRSAFFPDLVAIFEREYREGVRPRLTTAL